MLPFSFLVYYSDKGSSSNLVFFYTPFLFFYTPFLFFYTTFWAYSQVPLKLWLNASSRHGDTLPSVFSINKKRNLQFLAEFHFCLQGDSNPRSFDNCTWTSFQLGYGTVDKNATILGVNICNMLCLGMGQAGSFFIKIRNVANN